MHWLKFDFMFNEVLYGWNLQEKKRNQLHVKDFALCIVTLY